MKSRADAGNIISKKLIKIKKKNYDSNLVYSKLIKVGRKQIREILLKIRTKN